MSNLESLKQKVMQLSPQDFERFRAWFNSQFIEYVVTLELDTNHTYWVRCPDVPEMNSVGDTVEDALKEAVDGLETALSIYKNQGRPMPSPTPAKKGDYTVRLRITT